MYPSTTFIIEDRSQITDLQIDEQFSAPLFAQFFSSDKGPEEMGEYYGEDFQKTYGDPNFARHGQPLLQAQRLINNGARVLAKRVVAPDSTLANLVVLAKVKTNSSQKTNTDGEPLYMTPEGEETTTADGNEAIITKKCHIEYELQTIENNKNDIDDLKDSALALADYEGKTADDEKTYPICLVADNGRGVSAKKFKITSNSAASRNKSYTSYVLSVIENSAVVESTLFTLNPDISTATSNLSLSAVSQTYLTQVKAFSFDDVMTEFIAAVKESTGIEDIDNVDILFGKNKRGVALDAFEIAGDVDLSIPVGLPLKSGSNGSFGNSPMKSADYTTALVEAFNGTFSLDIFDVDNILLDGIIDANYPNEVKKAIEALIEFREDGFYFRDLGTGLYGADDIIAEAELVSKSRYIGVYANSYDVVDDYSKKQITVTACYTLAKYLPKHFSDRRNSPVAGQMYGFIFDEVVEGTVNYLPKVIPGKNQKEELFEKRINFISYLDKVATLESEYTTQEEHTGFSYINNTIAAQQVIKAIRVNCPKTRYSFMEADDLVKYSEDVQVVLDKYKSNFGSLTMEYAADPIYEQNLVYYAVLYVRFKKFVQAEVFRIIAINDDEQISAI